MSSDDSKDPIESAIKGITKGTLEWSSKTILDLIKKLKEKKLAFIQDEKTIKIVKEQYNSGELAIYKTHIIDKRTLNKSILA
jgi:hypothetical protein